MVKLIEKPKEGKNIQRIMSVSQEQAERILKKSKGWTLPNDSKYTFKDGALLLKGEKSRRKKPKSEEEEDKPD